MKKSSTNDVKRVEHTAGPWYVDKPYGEPGVYVSAAKDTSLIAKVYEVTRLGWPHECAEGNARLMAAAPDLLEALEECLTDLEHYVSTHGPGPDVRLAKAKAAIAKARGQ